MGQAHEETRHPAAIEFCGASENHSGLFEPSIGEGLFQYGSSLLCQIRFAPDISITKTVVCPNHFYFAAAGNAGNMPTSRASC